MYILIGVIENKHFLGPGYMQLLFDSVNRFSLLDSSYLEKTTIIKQQRKFSTILVILILTHVALDELQVHKNLLKFLILASSSKATKDPVMRGSVHVCEPHTHTIRGPIRR